MPDRTIAGRAGRVYHVVNRAIEGQLLFRDFGEYLAFQHRLIRALTLVPTRLLAYCLMPNHWHLVVQPHTDEELTLFIRWLSMTHAKALRCWRGSPGRGAVYQSRYRASPVQTERYFYIVMRYVERNAARAGLVERAQDWLWSSASAAVALQGVQLAPWPLPRPRGWSAFLNEGESAADVEFIRLRTKRNEPIAQPSAADAVPAIVRRKTR
jgi:putative transposase